MKIAILGCGKAGKALGRVLQKAGHDIRAVTCRTPERAREAANFVGAEKSGTDLNAAAQGAEVVLLGVPDGVLAEVSRDLKLESGAVLAHLSGVCASEVLAPHTPRGAVHPLRSFADPEKAAASFRGTFCAVEGEPAAVTVLKQLMRDVGGVTAEVPFDRKVLYHAGAVFASNYVVVVYEQALRLFEAAGISRDDAHRALLPLTQGTVANMESVGLPRALTGPIERGDVESVRLHAEELKKHRPEAFALYRDLARVACDVALEKGTLSEEKAAAIRSLFR